MKPTFNHAQAQPPNAILQGDCVEIMNRLPANSIDFILTDPPYLVNYRDRNGRTIQNDEKSDWLKPAMANAFRVLKQNRLMVCFYGWGKIDEFFAAWIAAGFRPVGHLVFRKRYSSASKFLSYQHEQAYLLAKGFPFFPKKTIPDVVDMPYSGNKLHPTQKPVEPLARLIRSFTSPNELVLDCFAGSGSTCAAAALTGRQYLGIELDPMYHIQAVNRMTRVKERIARRSSQLLPDSLRVPAVSVKQNYGDQLLDRHIPLAA